VGWGEGGGLWAFVGERARPREASDARSLVVRLETWEERDKFSAASWASAEGVEGGRGVERWWGDGEAGRGGLVGVWRGGRGRGVTAVDSWERSAARDWRNGSSMWPGEGELWLYAMDGKCS